MIAVGFMDIAGSLAERKCVPDGLRLEDILSQSLDGTMKEMKSICGKSVVLDMCFVALSANAVALGCGSGDRHYFHQHTGWGGVNDHKR